LADFTPETTRRVVIADDSEKNREAFREMFTKFVELYVTEAETAAQCLSLLQSGEFDAVFVSLTLPQSHGFTILRAVSDGSIPRPGFVAAISERADADSGRLDDEGCQIDTVVQKPFNFNEVQSVLSDLANSTFEDDLLAGLLA
jgi:CheY-like chemotaxis protein